MKKIFFEFYKYNEKELKNLFEDALFVFDANVLLNLYRYSHKTSEAYLNLLKTINARLWLPHQSALEYHENRLKTIREGQLSYSELSDSLKKEFDDLKEKLKQKYSRHPF